MTRGTFKFEVTAGGDLVDNPANVECLRKLWLDRTMIDGDDLGPGNDGDFDHGAWHSACHLVGGGGVRRASDGKILWLEVSHDPAKDEYYASVTVAGGGATHRLDSVEGRALLQGSTLLGFVEGNSVGHISARNARDPDTLFNGWKRQDFEQSGADEDGGKVWEHWCTVRDIRPPHKIGSSVLRAYVSLVAALGDKFVPAVARGRRDYGHPTQLCAMVRAGLTAEASATWDTTPHQIPDAAEKKFLEARPADEAAAAATLQWDQAPRYYMFERRIRRWSKTDKVKEDLRDFGRGLGMRKPATNGDLSVRAIAGSYVTLLGLDIRAGSPMLDGLLGFALWRRDQTDNREGWLPGMKRFTHDAEDPHPSKLTSTHDNPLQGFLWGDYAVKAGHTYTYRVVPMYGAPGALTEGQGVELTFTTEPETGGGGHSVYFNRGAAASQAYARRFKNEPPDRVKNPDAYPWLSRGLEEGMQRFIRRAKTEGLKIRAAVYEFHYDRVLAALTQAARDGVDVQVVYDCKPGDGKPGARNAQAITDAGLDRVAVCRSRAMNPSYISHNKFMVLLDGTKAVSVWTGSTNITEGGIFGHSNLAHVVDDPKVAGKFLDYWTQLSADPKAADLRAWNDAHTKLPRGKPPVGTTAIFSPRGSVDALQYYADLMNGAQSGVFFTAAFGVNARLRKVLATDKPYLRYLLLERDDLPNAGDPDIEIYRRDKENLIAVGSHLEDNVLETWVRTNFAEEELTGVNKHVKYIHTKYMLIDPLGDDPIVITGSANFSDASTKNNDENMLIIRGDTRVADIYLGEFMRLYTHYRFRAFAQDAAREGKPPQKLFLAEDHSWTAPYYVPDSVKSQERRMFAGVA